MALENIKQSWEQLSPKTKRSSTLGVALGGLLLLLTMYVSGTNDGPHKRGGNQDIVKTPLTADNGAALGVEALAAKLNAVRKEMDEDARKNASLRDQLLKQNEDIKKDLIKQDRALRDDLSDSRKEVDQLKTDLAKANEQLTAQQGSTQTVIVKHDGSPDSPTSASDAGMGQDKDFDLFHQDLADNIPINSDGKKGSKGTATPAAAMQITAVGEVNAAKKDDKKVDAPTNPPMILPAGSMITGTLVTGMDAPTGVNSQKQPSPTLIRIKREAILPNYYESDIRECFMLAGGYGDLSSERAMLRAERISCISDSGAVLETKIDAYASGEDGKAGMRGKVVSRMGQALANAALAGFAGGVAQAFAPQRVPVISTDANQAFSNVDPTHALNSGFGGGAQKALDKVADYYLNLADQTFPTIEIDAGRQVTFILVRGISMPVDSGRNVNQQ